MNDTKNKPNPIKIPVGIITSVKVWLNKHQACGGEFVTYVGTGEFRIECTCQDKS